jgi:hypothetical protein|mmetsp:Transcript_5540/g.6143  ORF Transcript_5540/g.6143 Transcript_5540/m.6143 type:complete len:177 (-) Transcript_5540:206-736(-)
MAIVPRTKLSKSLQKVKTHRSPLQQPRRRIFNDAIKTTTATNKLEPSDFDVILSRAPEMTGNPAGGDRVGILATTTGTSIIRVPMHKRKGNLMYFALMKSNLKAYVQHKDSEKHQFFLAQSIVETITSQPGRFLWRDPRTNSLAEMKNVSAIKLTLEGFELLHCGSTKRNSKQTKE